MWFDLWILARTLGHLLPFRPPERVAYGDLSRWSATTRPSAVTPSSAVESVLSGTEA
jgi:hypothetical protein